MSEKEFLKIINNCILFVTENSNKEEIITNSICFYYDINILRNLKLNNILNNKLDFNIKNIDLNNTNKIIFEFEFENELDFNLMKNYLWIWVNEKFNFNEKKLFIHLKKYVKKYCKNNKHIELLYGWYFGDEKKEDHLYDTYKLYIDEKF